jgi:hypothetical protein
LSVKEKIANTRAKDNERIDLPDLLGVGVSTCTEGVLELLGILAGVCGPVLPRISGKKPVFVVSTKTTGVADKAFEVAAAMLFKSDWP